jgi:hypothetical protein
MKRTLIAAVLTAAALVGGVAATVAPASAATGTCMYHHSSTCG